MMNPEFISDSNRNVNRRATDSKTKMPESRENSLGIPLSADMRQLFDGLKFESSISTVPFLEGIDVADAGRIHLTIGKHGVYISRRDVNDPSFQREYSIPLQVARLQIGDDANIKGVVVDDKVLAPETFALLSKNTWFSDIIRKFAINTESDSDTSIYKKRANDKAGEKIMEAQKLVDLSPNKRIERNKMELPDEELSVDVMMGETRFIAETSPERYIYTRGAGPCIVVIGYDPETKTVGMVHADAFTNITDATNRIVHRAGGRISVLGGQPESMGQLVELKKYLDARNIAVTEWDILNDTKSIVVDKETGEIFDISKNNRE